MFWLLWVIIVGLIAGWLAGKIMGTGGYGPVMDILLGIAGAIVGGFLLRLLGLYSAGGLISEIIVATHWRRLPDLVKPQAQKIKSFIVTFPSALLLCHSDAERGGGIFLASRLAYTSSSICTRLATADSSAALRLRNDKAGKVGRDEENAHRARARTGYIWPRASPKAAA